MPSLPISLKTFNVPRQKSSKSQVLSFIIFLCPSLLRPRPEKYCSGERIYDKQLERAFVCTVHTGQCTAVYYISMQYILLLLLCIYVLQVLHTLCNAQQCNTFSAIHFVTITMYIFHFIWFQQSLMQCAARVFQCNTNICRLHRIVEFIGEIAVCIV